MPIQLNSVALTGVRQVVDVPISTDVYDRVIIGNQSAFILDVDSGRAHIRLQPLAIDIIQLIGVPRLTVVPTLTSLGVVQSPQLQLSAVASDEDITEGFPQSLPNAAIPAINRWTLNSFPATGAQATATRAATPGVVHTADIGLFRWGNNTTAPAGSNSRVSIIDGPSGGAVFILTTFLMLTAVGGSVDSETAGPGLNAKGTAGNAMTIEFNAGLANSIQSVLLVGYDQ